MRWWHSIPKAWAHPPASDYQKADLRIELSHRLRNLVRLTVSVLPRSHVSVPLLNHQLHQGGSSPYWPLVCCNTLFGHLSVNWPEMDIRLDRIPKKAGQWRTRPFQARSDYANVGPCWCATQGSLRGDLKRDHRSLRPPRPMQPSSLSLSVTTGDDLGSDRIQPSFQ